jgi:hypothetical protein
MKKLTDEEIQSNYELQGRGAIDCYDGRGESVNCDRCGGHDETPGAGQNALALIRNRATHLPLSIELCDDCAIALRYINDELSGADRRAREMRSHLATADEGYIVEPSSSAKRDIVHGDLHE